MRAAACLGLLVALVGGVPPARGEEPPLDISADNVSGSHGPEGDLVFLNGNVRMTRGRTVLTAERGRYLRAKGMLFLDDHVEMVDSTATVTCDHVAYSEQDDILQLDGNVTIRDRDGTLRAPSATYHRRTGRADLYGGVSGTDRNQRLNADRATYDRDSLLVHARGNVRGYDEENKLELLAQRVDFDRRTREAVATENPELRSTDADGRVTQLRALTLRLNTETRVAEATDSVVVVRDSLQGRADYALFDDRENRGWLLGSPRLWDDQTTVSGDTLEVVTEKRVLQKVLVRGNAVLDYRGNRPETLGEATRLSGQRAEVYFTREDIDSLVALGGARNQYTSPPRAGQTAESNVASGDTITVFFKARKVDRARVEGRAVGEYHPAVEIGDTTAARRELIQYDARRIEFEVPKSRIVLAGASHLVYRDLELRARRVEYDVEAQTLVADGDPHLTDRGDEVTGHLMTYDLGSRVGTIYQAETAYERGLYHGDRIRKVGENELDVMSGQYTTCSLTGPHYHFAARWMKIYIKDKLVAKPVVFYIRNVPLLALPFWVFPIKPGRHSGFLFPQFEFGFSNQAGQFLRNAGYYWAPNDYMDLTVAGDYYQAEPSWVLRGDGVYKLLYVLEGNLRGSFARNEARKSEDWDFTADHSQQISPRSRLVARASFVSSRSYNSSGLFGRSLSQRLNRFLTSSVAFSHSADWASFNAVVDRRQDLDADASIGDPDGEGPLQGPRPGTVASLANLTETRPSLSIAFPTRTIGSLGLLEGGPFEKPLRSLYFSLSSRFETFRQRQAYVASYRDFLRDGTPDSTTILGQQLTQRRAARADVALSDARRAFGWLNLAPRLSASAVVFDFDELGHQVVPTGTWSSSVTSSATFYGNFRPRLGSIVGLRHVLFPSVSFNYSPDFPNLTYVDAQGIRRSRFNSFGGFGVSGFKNASMTMSLDQRLQVKLKRGDQVQRLDNLLSWGTSATYNFLYRERGLAHPLSQISSNIFVQPPRYLNASVGWVTDIYSPRPLRSLSFSSGLNLASGGAAIAAPALPVEASRPASEESPEFRDAWSLGLAYSYAGGYAGPTWSSRQTGNAVLHYQLSPGWALDYSASLDLTLRRVQTQRFSLIRELHCWEAAFTRTFTVGGEAEYYFRLGIKDLKEVFVERGTRVGSIGGIQ